jgi:Tetracyclin repressor-like, C-terminal domain
MVTGRHRPAGNRPSGNSHSRIVMPAPLGLPDQDESTLRAKRSGIVTGPAGQPSTRAIWGGTGAGPGISSFIPYLAYRRRSGRGAHQLARPSLRDQLTRYRDALGADIPVGAVLVFLRCWTVLYGAVSMEVFGHMRFALEDAAPMFEMTLGDLASLVGLRYPLPR